MTPGRSMVMATAILSAAAGVASGEGETIRVLLVARARDRATFDFI